MPFPVRDRAMGSAHPTPRIRFVPALVVWMSVAACVPAALAQIRPEIWSAQVHAGLFTPIEGGGVAPMVGLRYGKHMGSHVQGGLLTGWTMKSKQVQAPVEGAPTIDPRAQLAHLNAHLVPLMGFMQVNFTEKAWLVPFAGIGGGYEWLVLDAKDYQTGEKSAAKYGNLAWEAWAGVGVRMTSKVRMNGELFYNGGSLERGERDANGVEYREGVHMNGVGLRAGLDMVFE
jgi:hypothetical protein